MKRLVTTLFFSIATLAFAGSALAQSRVSANLEMPKAAASKIAAAHAVWQCVADKCIAEVAPDGVATLGGCKDLAKAVGRLTAFVGVRPMSADNLAKCNLVAATSKTETTAGR